MPDYLVTDPATGQRIKMSGPAPPSEALIRLALAQVKPLPSHVQQTADPLQAMQKAQTIGPARVGERYQEDLNPSLVGIARKVLGGAQRPASVAAEDPYGIGAWLKGAGPMPTPIAAEIQAYHGSPHDFEKFLSEKIGSGEGAQAYGHGLYFAENPAVAESYKTAGGHSFLTPSTVRLAQDALTEAGSGEGQIARARDILYPKYQAETDPFRKRWYQDAYNNIADIASGKTGGKTYEVSIKADPDQFLDWDKPLSQQPPKVQEALKSLGVQPKPTVQWEAHQLTQADIDNKLVPSNYAPGSWISAVKDPAGKIEWHGGQLYGTQQAAADNAAMRSAVDQRALRDKGSEIYHDLGEATKADATAKLRQAGIPGIKYLDQGSRAQPYRGDSAPLHAAKSFLDAGHSAEDALAGLKATYKNTSPTELQQAVNEVYGTTHGTHNYVVFDDKLIDILKKYAVAGAVGGSLASLGQPQTEEQK